MTVNKKVKTINIHGQEYITVATRVQLAQEDPQNKDTFSIETEVIQHTPVVVMKATVRTQRGKFTGISAANPLKTIEKQSPYEVAETSAVGRALGFAGYGSVESITTADEMKKAIEAPYGGQPIIKEPIQTIRPETIREIYQMLPKKGKTLEDLQSLLEHGGVKSINDLTQSQGYGIIKRLNELPAKDEEVIVTDE